MKRLLLLIALSLIPSLALAAGVLTPAANPQQAITVLSQSGIPFIKASSGTMGDNGAISGMTALPRTFSTGAYLYLPAGVVAAGVPAAPTWYWFVASSTTAGTVYNSIYTTGTPVIGTLTAFATTGPGAYAGATTTPTAVTVTVPANLMGPNGRVEVETANSSNTTAGAKNQLTLFGGATCSTGSLTTHASSFFHCTITNRGVTNRQALSFLYGHSSSGAQGISQATDGTVATSADVNITFTVNTAVATDHTILDSYRIVVMSGN